MNPLALLLALVAPFAAAKDKPAVSHDGSFELAVPRGYFVEKDGAGGYDMTGVLQRLMVLRASGSSEVNGPRVWINTCRPGERPGMTPAELLDEVRRERVALCRQYHTGVHDTATTPTLTRSLANGMTLHYFFEVATNAKTRKEEFETIHAILQSGDSLYTVAASGAGRDSRSFWFLPVLEAMRATPGKAAHRVKTRFDAGPPLQSAPAAKSDW